MRINRCDNCNKIIKGGKDLVIKQGYKPSIELCAKCAEPILSNTISNKLLKSNLLNQFEAPDPCIELTKSIKRDEAKAKAAAKASNSRPIIYKRKVH